MIYYQIRKKDDTEWFVKGTPAYQSTKKWVCGNGTIIKGNQLNEKRRNYT